MQKTISLLYRAVSKVTAEIPDHKGQQIKQAYAGTFSDLFSDIKVGERTITKFIWVITHKVGELSSPLFKRDENGALIRNCSGFYTYQDQPDGTKKKVHITGEALVEYLYSWMQEYKVAPRENKPIDVSVIPTTDTEKIKYLTAGIPCTERKLRSLEQILDDVDRIVKELDAMGMYLVADKHGYGVRRDFDPVI